MLVVKPTFEDNPKEIFISNINIKTTSAREKHLGAIIDSQIYQKNLLAILLKYSAYIHGFKDKRSSFSKIILNMHNLLKILEQALLNNLIYAETGE